MTKEKLTKTDKRKILFEQTCEYITSLGFDGPHDDDGYGHNDFYREDLNMMLNLRRSSMSLCVDKINWNEEGNRFKDGSPQTKLEEKVEKFIENQKKVLELDI